MNTLATAWLAASGAGLLALILLISLIRLRLRSRLSLQAGSERELLQSISRQLNALDRIGERVEGLDRAFRIPRMRGGFGETLLEELLRSWLPPGSWASQYAFSSGVRVDAVVKMGSRLAPVDSKFPMERLESWLSDDSGDKSPMPSEARKAFVQHARDIASRYIRPDEGTLSFALMYLPAENIHYRLLRDDDGTVMKECLSLHVLPVGPLSLFAYLQTVAYGLKGLALPAEGRELRRRVDRVRRDFTALVRPLSVAAGHLKNLNGSWQEIERLTGRLDDGIEALDAGAETAPRENPAEP